jgi:aryl-alcohol dehydrogenase-like predicted oxidoreductase
VQEGIRVADLLREIAKHHSTTPAALAIAFGLAGPRVSTVLFGATQPEQVLENAGALDVDPAILAEVGAVGLTAGPDL